MPVIINGSTGISGTDGSAATPAVQGTDTNTGMFFPAADQIAFAEGGVEAMRLDASGNVGIGVAAPARRLDIQQSGTNYQLRIGDAGGANFYDIGRDTSNGLLTFYGSQAVASGYVFSTVNGERARITTAGEFLVGVASGGGGANDGRVTSRGISSRSGYNGSFSSNIINIHWTGTAQLWIDSTNVGTIAFTSDYRIKRNIETQAQPALARVLQLRPVTYQMADYGNLIKASDDVREGFIAHELAAVIPSAVSGEKDAANQLQSLKLDALCSVLVKAIQEQQAQIAELKARLAAVEAR